MVYNLLYGHSKRFFKVWDNLFISAILIPISSLYRSDQG